MPRINNKKKLSQESDSADDLIDENDASIDEENTDNASDNSDDSDNSNDSDNSEDLEDSTEISEEEPDDDSDTETKKKINSKKTKEVLKKKILEWLDIDDKIKDLAKKSKDFKDHKKKNEEFILKLIDAMKIADQQITVDQRGKVYKHKSVTKGPIKEDTLKSALMEALHNEKKVMQLVKKIEAKRPVNERFYLKRTKGNKKD